MKSILKPCLLVALSAILTACIYPQLNDTGIDWGGNYPGGNNTTCTGETIAAQDCSHGRDAIYTNATDGHAGFSFTKLDANGNKLPASASDWVCVRDEVTGLTWEVKTDDGGLRDADNTYSWHNPDYYNGGGSGFPNFGSCTGSLCDTYHYVQAVNSQTLCGADDWRMPSREELRSIVDYGLSNPAIDTSYFPYSGNFWSDTPYGDPMLVGKMAWNIEFSDGLVGRGHKYNDTHVRLVRGGQ